MKDNKDILAEAIKALKNEQVPPGPPQELIDATLAKLRSSELIVHSSSIGVRRKLTTKLAAAAVLLVGAGYIVGRLSTPRPPGLEQLYISLEPAIRQKVLEEVKHYWQASLASSYAQLRDELSAEYRRDLSEYAIQTLAVSGAMTNQRLEELIQAIDAAQRQDRRWVTTALELIESNRIRDKTQLSNGLETLAVRTADELTRTKEDMVQLLVYTQPGEVKNQK